MSDQKRKNVLKEPQEEFIDDGLARLEKNKDPTRSPKYEKWSMEELQREAERKKITDYMGLNKKDLIRKLQNAGVSEA
jgi:hypothetical protein